MSRLNGLLVFLLTLIAPFISSGVLRAQESPTAKMAELLRSTIDMKPFQSPMTMQEFFGILHENLAAQGKEFPFKVDVSAFRRADPDAGTVWNTEVRFQKSPSQMTIGNALRFVVGEIKNFEATFLIRGGVLEVVPKQETAREVMLNYPVTAVFKSRIFHHAIQELADETGVSIVVDGKLEKLGEKTVTASFHNGVAVQDAVRMLAELVDLKVVHLPTGLFITSPEHAKKMRMELDELYERQPGQPSPLAPPLPPLARSQGAAASIRMPLAKQ